MIDALDIHVKGIVQGVGFRPFVYRLAKKYLVNGWVLNAADGVHIHAEAEEKLLDEFVMELSDNAPAAAQVTEIEMREVPLEPFDTFEIRFSEDKETGERTLVSPDLATCADCERELFDKTDRRFRYPFINCTNCGPRFTIIDELPYDRATTSMADFVMCEQCEDEYANPANRRFHAQPDACFECGPHVFLQLTDRADAASIKGFLREIDSSEDDKPSILVGSTRAESDRIFKDAVKMLMAGKILAVKGLGGFHLVCDAGNAEAVAELRRRKHREGKAFAVMMQSLEDVRKVCEVNDEEAGVLGGSERPIVLLKKREDANIAPGVADALPELGVMLPYTPVQHILLHDFAEAKKVEAAEGVEVQAAENDMAADGAGAQTAENDMGADVRLDDNLGHRNETGACCVPMLVMTSGNLHDEPIVTSDQQARAKLNEVADAILGNNREILSRFDDSVVRIIRAGSEGDAIQMIRRARGYAPLPILLGETFAQESYGVAEVSGSVETPDDTKASGVMGASGGAKASNSAEVSGGEKAPGSAKASAIFATGPEQKNTFAFLRGQQLFASQHIGDMENAETFDAWLQAKARYERLFDLHADALACDMHPEYITSKWAHEQAESTGLSLTEVQHHHAHIVSVMAENRLTDAVCGIAFDGTGYGVDGAIWGGEVLLSNLSEFERFANFSYVPMPGGAACVKHPLRMAYGVLWAFDLLEHPGAQKALEALGTQQAEICETMIDQGINTPMTSSVGRLFDAASALLGVCTQPTYEGEPAILLEAAMYMRDSEDEDTDANASSSPNASANTLDRYAVGVIKNTATENSTAQDTSVVLFDAASTFKAMLDDLVAGVPVAVISRRFHNAIIGAILQAAQLVNALYGIRTVALTGGVFMNRYIIENALAALEQAGFTVAINRELPPNDGCISCGQAVVAWAKANKGDN